MKWYDMLVYFLNGFSLVLNYLVGYLIEDGLIGKGVWYYLGLLELFKFNFLGNGFNMVRNRNMVDCWILKIYFINYEVLSLNVFCLKIIIVKFYF